MTKEEIILNCSKLSLVEMEDVRNRINVLLISSRRKYGGKSSIRSAELMKVMADVMGLNLISLFSRESGHVWARTMVAYQMIKEGYSTSEIGGQMLKNHSTITHLKNKMEDVFAMPQAYGDILEIWNEFQKQIEL